MRSKRRNRAGPPTLRPPPCQRGPLMSTDPAGLPERPITDEFSDWRIEPVEPVGWNATRTINGSGTIHVIGAATIAELRTKLREIRSREALA